MDELGDRATLLANVERILSSAAHEQRQRNSSQSSMFDALAGDPTALEMPTIELAAAEAVSDAEKGVWEKELMGIHFSNDPYKVLRAAGVGADITPCGDVSAEMERDKITVAGNITSVRTFMVRGESAASIELNDQSGSVAVTVWPDVYGKSMETWQINTPVRVTGSVRVREEEPSVDCRQYEVLVDDGTAQGSAPARSRASNGRNGHSSEQTVHAENADGTVAVAEPPIEVAPPNEVEAEPVEAAAPTVDAVETVEHTAESAPEAKSADDNAEAKADTPNGAVTNAPPQASGTSASTNGSGDGAARRVLISVMMHETADEEADVDQLKRVVEALKGYPGESPVQLVIMQQGEQSVMTMPFQTAHSQELETEIAGILGGSYLTVQPLLM